MPKKQATYTDGFVLVVPKKRVAEYRAMATDAAKVWVRFGALSYRECMIDDGKPKHVTVTFPMMAKAKPGETVWFSYIEFKSKSHRNQVNAKVMKFFEKKYKDDAAMQNMPFDMKRMAYGGFKIVASA